MNTVMAVNPRRYGALLAKALPKVLETKQEYEDALSMIRGLMERDENELSPEEAKLLDLLVTLTDHYEEQHYPIDRSSPHAMLMLLMDARGLSHKDIWPVLGSKGVASEVLHGKRSISKTQARRLADFFHTPADLFI